MFNKNNFCHIASNNRNEKKAGVFVYKTTDGLATVSASGYFNDKIVDINLHDLIIHEWHDATDRTKVQKNVLCVTERTLDNVGTVVIKSKWEEDVEQSIEDLRTYVDETFVRLDGTSVMTGPLLMRATDDFKCGIAPYWDGVGFFKLNDNNSVTLIASMEYQDSFTPADNNVYNVGTSLKKWKNLYLSGIAYIGTINNGVNLTVPTPAQADTLAVLGDIAFKSTDVAITSPSNGQFLMYDGNKWINSTQGYANTDLSNLTATGEAKFTAKANTDMDNLTDKGKNIGLWCNNAANIITEIPQDIDLELNAGVLTVKAGSKIYVPNGFDANNDPIFNVITLTNDVSVSFTNANTYDNIIICLKSDGTAPSFFKWTPNDVYSGTTPVQYNFCYRTDLNKLYDYEADTTTPYEELSLPICICSFSNNAITSIKQIFNGFGYIGSTVFVLPGVKGLIPNGRNTDGTLNNTTATIEQVRIFTPTQANYSWIVFLAPSGSIYTVEYSHYSEFNKPTGTSVISPLTWFDTDSNKVYVSVDDGATWTEQAKAAICFGKWNNSVKVSYIKPKTAFHAVDYSDTEFIAHQAMPSNSYINLTLGADWSEYTAPADGYFAWRGNLRGTVGYFNLANTNLNIGSSSYTTYSGDNGTIGFCFVPVKKGDVVAVHYYASTSISTTSFRFIYANGAQ